MSRKQVLSESLNSQEEFDAFINHVGLKVVDAYSEWCGPCIAMRAIFRRIKNELGDDKLKFAEANVDKIASLQAYRGKSKPTFIYYGGNEVVAVIRGANSPEIERTIKEQLKNEHAVLEGKSARVSYADIATTAVSTTQLKSNSKISVIPEEAGEDHHHKGHKEYTFGLIKPHAIPVADIIFLRIAEAGFKIVKQEEVHMTEADVAFFYAEHHGKAFVHDVAVSMSSTPCIALVLSKATHAVEDFDQLVGPTFIEKAKETAPNSLRALYGVNNVENVAARSESTEAAYRNIQFFFPEWAAEHLPHENAVALITDVSVAPAHIEKLKSHGYIVKQEKTVTLTAETASEFLGVSPEAAHDIAGKPVIALEVDRVAAVRGLKDHYSVLSNIVSSQSKASVHNDISIIFGSGHPHHTETAPSTAHQETNHTQSSSSDTHHQEAPVHATEAPAPEGTKDGGVANNDTHNTDQHTAPSDSHGDAPPTTDSAVTAATEGTAPAEAAE